MIDSSLVSCLLPIVVSLYFRLLLTSGNHILKRNALLHFSDVNLLFKHQFSDYFNLFFYYRDNQYTVLFPDFGHRLDALCFRYMLNLNLLPVKQRTDYLVMLGCGTGYADMSIDNGLLCQRYLLFREFQRYLSIFIVFWLPRHIFAPVKSILLNNRHNCLTQ